MSITTTTHYGLQKPDLTELVTPAQFNSNFDVIDTTIYNKVLSGDATLSTSAWTGSAAPYSCALSISGVLATDTPIVWRVGTGDASADAITAAAWALCCAPGYEPDTAAGTLTIHASAVPTSNIPVHYEIVRGG